MNDNDLTDTERIMLMIHNQSEAHLKSFSLLNERCQRWLMWEDWRNVMFMRGWYDA